VAGLAFSAILLGGVGADASSYTIVAGGAPVTINTTAANENATLTFGGTAGQRISLKITGVTIGTSTTASLKVSITKPDGTALVAATSMGTTGGFIDTKTLPTTGAYTILVDPQLAATGSATLQLYDLPSDATAPITPGGAAVSVTTTVPGQNAKLTFSGTAGARVSVSVGPSCCSVKVSMTKPDGTSLVSATSFGTTGGFIDTKSLPTTGTYTIVVDPQAAVVGSVTVRLYDVPTDSAGSITPGGAPVTVTTTVPGQNAKLTFAGTAGRRISLTLSGVTIGTSTTSSLKVSITKPDGTVLLAATSLGTNGGFIDTKSLATTGTYTILVDPQLTATGSATLQLHDVPADTAGSITPGGAPVTVTTTVPGQNAKLTFAGTAGRRISLTLSGVTIGTSTTSSVKLSITRPDGSALIGATTLGTNGAYFDVKSLSLSGIYTILVDPQGTATGSATLQLYDVPADSSTSITPGGAPATATTTVPGQNAKLIFAGTAGRGIALKLSGVTIGTSTTSSLKLSITKPDGTSLVAPTLYGTNGTFIDTLTLPATGTYTILIDPQAAVIGSATVQLYEVAPEATASITPNGPPVSVPLGLYQNGRVTFAGTAGERVNLNIGFVPSACCTVNVSILNPGGTRLVNPIAVASGQTLVEGKTLPTTGTYTIVLDPYQTATGTVTLTLYDVPGDVTGTMTVGGPAITLTTTAAGQNARALFSGTAGSGVVIRTGPGNCCSTAVSLLKPDGTTLVSPVSFTTAGGALYANLTVTGTYTVLLDLQGTVVGSVSASVSPDNTPPGLALTLSDSIPDAFAQGTTAYYRPAAATGMFTVTATVTDSGSGAQKVTFPALSAGLTPTMAATDTIAPFLQNYSWTAGATLSSSTNTVTAYDKVGNTATATFTVRPDSAAPTTTDDTAAIGNAWKRTNQTVTLTPSDGTGSGVAATYYTTDGSAPTTASPTGTAVSLTSDGIYTVSYFSVDNVTNTEAVKTASTQIRVDKTAPAVTTTAPPAAIRNGQALTATASDALSGVVSVAYLYCAGTACTPSTVIGTSTTGPGYSITWSGQPADGPYQLLARATDAAGNTTDSAKRSVTVDNTAPLAPTLNSTPANSSNSAAPSFSFTGEAGATFQCALDRAAFAACTSPKAYSGLAAGSHTFQVRQTDTAGNQGPAASYTWTIDLTAPAAPTITVKPGNPSNSAAPSLSFTGEAGATFQCALDGAAFAACTSPKGYSGLAAGSHTFQVRQTDTAGNQGPAASYTWTIDLTAPAAPAITAGPSGTINATSASFSFTGEAGATFECALDGGVFGACSSPKAYGGLADGSHIFQVRQIDTAGNTGPAASRSWTVDTAPPNTSIDSSPTDPSAPDVAFAFSSPEAGATFECQLDGGGFSSCSSPVSYTGLSSGSHTFDVRAVDPAGNADQTPASFTWSVS
jgi:hypothetical protein